MGAGFTEHWSEVENVVWSQRPSVLTNGTSGCGQLQEEAAVGPVGDVHRPSLLPSDPRSVFHPHRGGPERTAASALQMLKVAAVPVANVKKDLAMVQLGCIKRWK